MEIGIKPCTLISRSALYLRKEGHILNLCARSCRTRVCILTAMASSALHQALTLFSKIAAQRDPVFSLIDTTSTHSCRERSERSVRNSCLSAKLGFTERLRDPVFQPNLHHFNLGLCQGPSRVWFTVV